MIALEKTPDLSRSFGVRGGDFLQRAVEALVIHLPVSEIWLFGSAARGEAKPDSDLDLVVVLKDGHGLKQPTAECFRILFGLRNVIATDVLALSESQWAVNHDRPFGVYGEAIKEGIRLYAAE
jgi:predicted nucleotidyltransferase